MPDQTFSCWSRQSLPRCSIPLWSLLVEQVLQLFLELRKLIDMFMTEQRCLVPELADSKFVWKLAFIVDLTSHIRFLNLKLQGETFLFCDLYWHVKAFRKKLSLIKKNLGSMKFASCKIFSTQIKVTLLKDYVLGIISYLVYVKNLRNVLKILF